MKKSFQALTATAFLLAAGCSDATGPEVDVTGRWSYSAPAFSSGTRTCSISGVTLDLTRQGDSFTGFTSGGEMRCENDGVFDYSAALERVTVRNASVDGNTVQFDLDSSYFRHKGTVTGDVMSGQLTVYSAPTQTGERVVFEGTFRAERQ